MSNQTGVLYVVATPIGNLEDITARASRVLAEVDLIAAEDTRHSRKLLSHLGVNTPMCAYHDHNERHAAADIIGQLKQGRNIALISDAGTPLVHDPGYVLLKLAHESGIQVVPVPGASALITALSAAGLSSDRFVFEGFLPEKHVARLKHMQELVMETRTMVFYEAPHRIQAFIADSIEAFGGERQACIARELTKYYESIYSASLSALASMLETEEQQRKGEFVIVIQGNNLSVKPDEQEAVRVLRILLAATSLKQAASLAAEITGLKKNELYKLGLKLQESREIQ